MLQAKDSLDLRLLNPMTLAFVGDGVYEMLAREEIVRRHISLSADRLHRRTVELVRASAQAAGFLAIEPLLTETELAVFKRGRNANGVTHPKNSSAAEYRAATGLEALFGWLYLSGENERLRALFQKILDDRQAGLSPGNQMLDGAKDEVSGQSDNRAATISQN